MQINTYDKKHVENLFDEAQNIAIIPAKVAGSDAYYAAAGLFHMLSEKFAHTKKNIKFVYTGKIPEECSGYVNKGDIESNVSQRDLIVTIDYTNTPADKVSYSAGNDVLTLKMGPVPKDFDLTKIKGHITGFDFDLVVTVGAQNLEDLGQIYKNLEEELSNAKIINIDNTKNNKRYGVVNVIDATAETLSTLVFKGAGEWNLVPDKPAARALLAGISQKEPTAQNG